MDVSREEFSVLVSISEGMDSLDQIEFFTGLDIEKLEEIYEQLEKLGFIKRHKKRLELTSNAQPLFAKHPDWMASRN